MDNASKVLVLQDVFAQLQKPDEKLSVQYVDGTLTYEITSKELGSKIGRTVNSEMLRLYEPAELFNEMLNKDFILLRGYVYYNEETAKMSIIPLHIDMIFNKLRNQSEYIYITHNDAMKSYLVGIYSDSYEMVRYIPYTDLLSVQDELLCVVLLQKLAKWLNEFRIQVLRREKR